ncbi:hypothetical protein NP493_606g00020 [Ridgeia piscesae]|uniref:Uncharacterized protein n=1 Tax=Ridgeia piscesae TaxID=27915 RepID=A0AAD9KV32_RIDPI|nr:hypothetical protein NP493_606g00020 [Ridgeia piscesae]
MSYDPGAEIERPRSWNSSLFNADNFLSRPNGFLKERFRKIFFTIMTVSSLGTIFTELSTSSSVTVTKQQFSHSDGSGIVSLHVTHGCSLISGKVKRFSGCFSNIPRMSCFTKSLVSMLENMTSFTMYHYRSALEGRCQLFCPELAEQ